MDLHELGAADQARLLRSREVTAVDLVQHQLARIERLDAGLGAFVTVTPERALEQAREVDADRSAGRALPPLAGVPTAIKDLTEVAGVRTTYGSRLWRDHVPTADAPLAARLRRAGLVSLGQTNTPELGLSSYTDNDVVGPARTPWDRRRTAGGSTGGGAAAVAARLVPFAVGSDGAGSLRIPASCCGVIGFKPSRDVVGRGPDVDWTGMVTDGPLGRSVLDVAVLLDVLTGRSTGAPASDRPFADVVDHDPPRLRIARWHAPHVAGAEASDESVAAWERTSLVLARLGHEVVDVANPFPPELDDHHTRIWSTAAATERLDDAQLPLLRPVTRYWLDRGRAVTGPDLARALQGVASAVRSATADLADFDVWLTPTLALPPPLVEWFDVDPSEAHRRELLFTPYAAPHNLAGLPSISLPMHWTTATADQPTLPVGVMLAGRLGGDAMLLRLARQLERAERDAGHGWADREPPEPPEVRDRPAGRTDADQLRTGRVRPDVRDADA